MEIRTEFNFGSIVYFVENTTVYEARIVGVGINEDIPDEVFYYLHTSDCEGFKKHSIYESRLFTSIEEAKQSIIDSIEVLSL